MIGNINYRILDSLVAEMVHGKSKQTQDETALSYEKVVHDIVCECENMAKSWDPENLYEDIQMLDYNVPEDKFDIEISDDNIGQFVTIRDVVNYLETL